MRVLVSPGTYDCLNVGDVAMLLAAVRRILAAWPSAQIDVLTAGAKALLQQCPGVRPVPDSGRRIWFSDRDLLGGVHLLLSRRPSERLMALKRALRRGAPRLLRFVVHGRLALSGGGTAALDAYLESFHKADMVVIAGQGTLTDKFPGHAALVLNTVEMAADAGKPAVMFGQGIGPITDAAMLSRAREVLPRAGLICLREKNGGAALLRAFGVSAGRVMVTGDDAIEMAFERRAPALGTCIGVNLRVASHAEVDRTALATLRTVVRAFAAACGAPLVPLPISHGEAADAHVLRELVPGSDGGAALRTPVQVLKQTARCRVVVTGAYHAAVFALAQGIPAVCLANSAYYESKFAGLRGMFGEGCEPLSMQCGEFPKALAARLARLYETAETLRPSLLDAAARQVEMGRAICARLTSRELR